MMIKGVPFSAPEQAVDELRALVEEARIDGVAPLDYSYESLERLEIYLKLLIQQRISHGLDRETFRWLIGAYLGEVLIRNLGGRWKTLEGTRAIVDIPDLTRQYCFFPTRAFGSYVQTPDRGALRHAVEQHDLTRMDRVLKSFSEELPNWLSRFEEIVRSQGGIYELSLVGVREAESFLKSTLDPTEDLREDAYQLCSRFVGEVVRVESGGSWEFSRDAMSIDFGFFCIGHRRLYRSESLFNPWFAVGSFQNTGKSGALVKICSIGVDPKNLP